jgi:hypothetical protein
MSAGGERGGGGGDFGGPAGPDTSVPLTDDDIPF